MRPARICALLCTAVALLLTALPAGAQDAPPAPVGVSEQPPVLPEPTYGSVAQEVLLAMDDGVQLAATLTFPSTDGEVPAPGTFPVVAAMTPYSRNGLCGCIDPDLFATRGMISAVVDVRGTGGSGGTLEDNFFSPREARDSAAVIEWLGTQPWSTGKVGMAGGSYVGITQYLAAGQRPEHLAAIVPMVAISDLYRDGYTHGGIVNLSFDLQYIAVQGAPGTAGGNNDPSLLQETLRAKLGQSPPGSIAFDYLDKPYDDDFYRDRSPITAADRIQVPVLDMGNWNDGLLRGQTEMYDALEDRDGVETRLFMDPCTHKGCGAPFAPLTNPPGRADTAAILFEFLDQHLRGADVPDRPDVEVFVQGANTYVTSESWPPADTRYERLALGAGTLTPTAPEGETSYLTNPVDGFSLAFNKYGTVAGTPYVPADQRLEQGAGATFRTPELAAPLRLTGPLALHLVAATTADDTDWYGKLSDVAPDGTETIITEGALRASHRELDPQWSRPERPYHPHTGTTPVEPGRFYEYDVEIWPTAYELAAGHRLQLRVTSSDLPTHLPGSFVADAADPAGVRIDLNDPATNTLRLGASYLLLPVSGGTSTTSAVPPGASRPTAAAAPKVPAAAPRTLPATGTSALPAALALLLVVGAALVQHSRRA